MKILPEVVLFIHTFLSTSVMMIPFFGDIQMLLFNTFFMCVIGLHWLLNNNICVLTVIEKLLRQKYDDEETFFGSIFGKLYSIGNDSEIYWYVLVMLLSVSLIKIFLYINGK